MSTECLGCQRLEDSKTNMVTLHDGTRVCTYCPQWMLETYAKQLLDWPLKKRQDYLKDLEKKKGPESTVALKARMTAIFNSRKKP